MSDASAPPPSAGPGSGAAPVVVPLAASGGGMKRLMGSKPRGEHRLTLRPQEITVEHAGALRAPLRFAPGSVVVASVDPGAASPGKAPSAASRSCTA